MENKNFYGLDLLRGMAGYGVAITHYLYFVQKRIDFEYYSFIFVEIFFVLSGFVLSNQLIKIHKEKNNVKIFYLRRLFRTIPLYLVALIFYTAISNNFNLDFFKFLFFIQKAMPNFVDNNYFMVAWSLSIEEFFYLIFPIYLILFNNIKASRLALYFIILLSLLKILNHENFSNDFLRTGTFLRLDSISLGFLLSIYFSKLINFNKIIITLILVLLAAIINYKALFFNNTGIYTVYFIFISQILSMLLVLFFCKSEFLISKDISKKICNMLATQTYSVYLFHLIVMHFLIMTNNAFINNLFVYIGILFIISTYTYKYFEKPILLLRPKYKNG
jgi:peptidoglycan/LPS O-acetylase OafA/YrhL